MTARKGAAAVIGRAIGGPADWFAVGIDAWVLGAESAAVIAMRSARLVMGGSGAALEAHRMIEEKVTAQMALGAALMTGRLGGSASEIASGALRHYAHHVRANRRRLSG